MNQNKIPAIYIMGINDSHLATAALLKDGKLIACVSEERFTRNKNQVGIPIQSLRWCLSQAHIDSLQLARVVVAGKNTPYFSAVVKAERDETLTRQNWRTHLYVKLRQFHFFFLRQKLEHHLRFLEQFNEFVYNLGVLFMTPGFRQNRSREISHTIGYPAEKIEFADHHTLHAYAALYSSPFPKHKQSALVFTSDGQGDLISTTLSIFKHGHLTRVSSTPFTQSLGALYTEVTIFLGMRPNDHEYKVMGLAPYAPPEEVTQAYQILSGIIWFDYNTLTFKTKIPSDIFSVYLKENLSGIRFDYIAAAMQRLTEKLLLIWVEAAIKEYRIPRIACGGGVFMNVKANQKIFRHPLVKEAFYMPSAGDESNAIGAAYFGYINHAGKTPSPLENLYLGPQYSNQIILTLIKKLGLRKKYLISYHTDIEKVTADLLTNNKMVARFADRMEWGARALGNRSILVSAQSLEVKDVINKMIKARDFWMPFAPLILDTWRKRYLKHSNGLPAPYMIITFDSTPLAQKHLRAALHPYDLTLRPQILEKTWNPSLYRILQLYAAKTKMGGLLNTSFNIHGEPIVCSPEDALDTFARSGLFYLIMNNYLIQKRDHSNSQGVL